MRTVRTGTTVRNREAGILTIEKKVADWSLMVGRSKWEEVPFWDSRNRNQNDVRPWLHYSAAIWTGARGADDGPLKALTVNLRPNAKVDSNMEYTISQFNYYVTVFE